jgi:hypothetical protein
MKIHHETRGTKAPLFIESKQHRASLPFLKEQGFPMQERHFFAEEATNQALLP